MVAFELPRETVIATPPEWMRDGLCQEHLDVDFFPERGENNTAARRVCERCSVQGECLAFALDERIDAGIWGGASGNERRRLRRAGITGELVRTYGPHAVQGGEHELGFPKHEPVSPIGGAGSVFDDDGRATGVREEFIDDTARVAKPEPDAIAGTKRDPGYL